MVYFDFISSKVGVSARQIAATVALLNENATIPFIARYRKEMTKGLDEEQIRTIQEVYEYELKLEKRKEDVELLLIPKDERKVNEITRQIEDDFDMFKSDKPYFASLRWIDTEEKAEALIQYVKEHLEITDEVELCFLYQGPIYRILCTKNITYTDKIVSWTMDYNVLCRWFNKNIDHQKATILIGHTNNDYGFNFGKYNRYYANVNNKPSILSEKEIIIRESKQYVIEEFYGTWGEFKAHVKQLNLIDPQN